MKVIEVNTPTLDHSFVTINALINKDNPNYIRPLDNEVLATFDPTKNKLYKDGAAKRWVIQDDAGNTIGRIAAFHYKKYINKNADGSAAQRNDIPDIDFPMFRLADVYLMYAECAERGFGSKAKRKEIKSGRQNFKKLYH